MSDEQARRWLAAGVFEAMTHDLRLLLHEATERIPQPRVEVGFVNQGYTGDALAQATAAHGIQR